MDASSKLMTLAWPAVAQGLHDGRHRRARLDLDHQADAIGQPIENLDERGDAKPLARVRRLAPRVSEARSGVEAADPVHGEAVDAADAVGGAVDRVVVDDRQLSVLRQVHVELDGIGPRLHPQAEGLHGVLRRLDRCAPMRHHQRHDGTSPGGTMAGSKAAASGSSSAGGGVPSGTRRTIRKPITISTSSDRMATW